MMRPLVAAHGPGVVYAAGLRALGYPPTWAGGERERAAVARETGAI